MFEEYKEILKKAYRLARERSLFYQKYCNNENKVGHIDMADVEDGDEIYKKKEDELFNYLNELDYNVVKIIQTIMYLGRDKEYFKEDPPELIYKKLEKDLEQSWNDKEVEVYQIFQKMPLDRYLKDGFEILKINI